MTQALKFASVMNVPTGEAAAGAIDLDGTNDYFSRASDLSGNADGKTFTFSFWVRKADSVAGGSVYTAYDGSTGMVRIYTPVVANDCVYMDFVSSSGVTILVAYADIPILTFNHVLISVDLSNASNRAIYINDVAATVTWSTYVNSNIDFTKTVHYIGATVGGGQLQKGRLAHVFLDYTYRDLSVEANRRYFITADRKPAASSSTLTSGIIYMPMDDPTTAHVNLGTGGNFTLNGTIARSGRGPNQFNVPYSDLDGTNDYLNIASLTGAGSTKTFTFSCVFNTDYLNGGTWRTLMEIQSGPWFYPNGDGGGKIWLSIAGGATQASFSGNVAIGRNIIFTCSIDLNDTNKRHAYINGVAATASWDAYSNTAFDMTGKAVEVGDSISFGSGRFDGRLGNVFFHTSYIDLSVPANLAKFVTGTGIDAKPVDPGADGSTPLGVQPLIYLPMYGNNAGKNFGSGGDFTVNSGPYTGARGPNEFWGNKADFDGSTGYLSKASALTGVANSKTISFSFYVTPDAVATNNGVIFAETLTGGMFYVQLLTNGHVFIGSYTAAGGNALEATIQSGMSNGTSYHVCFCADLTNTGKRFAYVNGTSTTTTYAQYVNAEIDLTNTSWAIGSFADFTNKFDGKISELYFSTEYIDFSSEANRLKFRDCFGAPTNLPALIEAGSIPTPAIYMRFPPDDQGRNDGTGGAFVKSGTIADAGQL